MKGHSLNSNLNTGNICIVDTSNLLSPETASLIYKIASHAAKRFSSQLPSDVIEDIPSEVYLKMIRSTSKFSPELGIPFSAWVSLVATRKAIEHIEHSKIDRHYCCETEESSTPEEDLPLAPSTDFAKIINWATPEDVAIRNDESEILAEFISSLSDRDQIVVLKKLEGFSSIEIASQLNLTVSVVDVIYHRAKQKMISLAYNIRQAA